MNSNEPRMIHFLITMTSTCTLTVAQFYGEILKKVCTLGQISGALYQVGGQYRRNM